MNNVELKDLTPEDLNTMSELFVTTFSREPWNEDWDNSLAFERLELFMNHPAKVAVGGYFKGELIGFLLGSVQPYQRERYFYLEEMCVDAKFQGKGLGTRLWGSLEEKLKQKGVSSLSFLTLEESAAENFYKKQGCVFGEGVRFMKKDL